MDLFCSAAAHGQTVAAAKIKTTKMFINQSCENIIMFLVMWVSHIADWQSMDCCSSTAVRSVKYKWTSWIRKDLCMFSLHLYNFRLLTRHGHIKTVAKPAEIGQLVMISDGGQGDIGWDDRALRVRGQAGADDAAAAEAGGVQQVQGPGRILSVNHLPGHSGSAVQ